MVLKIRKNKKSYTIADIYRDYIKKNDVELNYARYKRIIDEFNKVVKEEILERSQTFNTWTAGVGLWVLPASWPVLEREVTVVPATVCAHGCLTEYHVVARK